MHQGEAAKERRIARTTIHGGLPLQPLKRLLINPARDTLNRMRCGKIPGHEEMVFSTIDGVRNSRVETGRS